MSTRWDTGAAGALAGSVGAALVKASVGELPISKPQLVGTSVAAVVFALIATLWKRHWSLSSLTAALVFIVETAGASERGTTLVAAGLLVIALYALAWGLERTPDTVDVQRDEWTQRALAETVAALVASAFFVHGARFVAKVLGGGDRFGLDSYVWNPQFELPLWVGFSAVIAVLPLRLVAPGLFVGSMMSGLTVLIIRGDTVESGLAFACTWIVLALLVACRTLRPKSRMQIIVAHAAALGFSGACVGLLLGMKAGPEDLWWRHGVPGLLAGCATGSVVAFYRGALKTEPKLTAS